MAAIPMDDVEVKPDGIIYLPEIKYRRILNRAFGPGGWGLAPRGETIVTGKSITREYALVVGGRYVFFFSLLLLPPYIYHKARVLTNKPKKASLHSPRRTRLLLPRRYPHGDGGL